MIKVIKNGCVITMDEKKEKQYEYVDIVIENNIITDIVDKYDDEADEVIDAKGKIVMPGLINCHTHLGMSIFRATNDNLGLDDWLNKKIWPIENNMTDEDVYYSTLLSCLEMLETGTTCFNDMYFGCFKSIDAIKEMKIRGLFSRCLMDNDNNGDERIEEFRKLYENNKDNDLIRFAVAPHSLYTCSKNYLKKCSDLALELDLPLHIHFCENENEVKTITKNYHCDPVKALDKTGLLRNKLILAHGTFITDKGLKLFKDKNVSICHNPISNLNLGCGIADIVKYKDYVNMCLGTDGQGSGNNMNLFYHMSVVDLLQKGKYKDSTITSSYETLKMATINGAHALGLDKEIGSIEIGKKADIIILDVNSINTYPNVDVITNIVHNIETINVESVMINGELLIYKHKLLLNLNKDALKEKVEEMLQKLMKKDN